MSGDAGSFLDRWSRRKAAVRDGRAEPEAAAEPSASMPAELRDAPAGPAPVDEDALSDAELAEHHGLPDPAAMQAGDDVAAFMRAGVPARLRRLALRRLWKLNPEIVAHDGLTDYAEDYTDAATVMPGMKTLYQVGRGAAAHLEDLAERLAVPGEAAGAAEEPGPRGAEDPAVDGTAELAAVAGPPLEPAAVAADAVGPESGQGAERAPVPRAVRRHMVFTAPHEEGG